MKKYCRIIVVAFAFLMLASTFESSAQCAMCRRVAESNIESGQKQGRGLNAGILYIMSIPYLLGGVAGFIWWKNRGKQQ
jgi:hypothetical protein